MNDVSFYVKINLVLGTLILAFVIVTIDVTDSRASSITRLIMIPGYMVFLGLWLLTDTLLQAKMVDNLGDDQ